MEKYKIISYSTKIFYRNLINENCYKTIIQTFIQNYLHYIKIIF